MEDTTVRTLMVMSVRANYRHGVRTAECTVKIYRTQYLSTHYRTQLLVVLQSKTSPHH